MTKLHVVCIPYPAQGHINPMMQVAKLLHSRGFYITFVNTEVNHNRLLKYRGSECLDGFRFEAISDGLPPCEGEGEGEIKKDVALCESIGNKRMEAPFRDLIRKLDQWSDGPPVSCIVSDGAMSFTLGVAEELGIPEVLFWPTAACSFMAFLHYLELITRGLTPFKDESCFSNGYLDTIIDWIPGMRDIRLRDLPSFIRTTDPDDIMFNFVADEAQNAFKASAIIFNTFDDLEHDVLCAIRSMRPRIYTIGPLTLQCGQMPNSPLKSIRSNLWKDDMECLKWLDQFDVATVIYVNFGSSTVMTAQQLIEFAWGLANSGHPFLWVIRPDLVRGDHAILPQDLMDEMKGRGMLSSWCLQEEVLSHPSIGGFLTHCGWNSTVESICGGVPMICWPFFADQQTNCHYICKEWGLGMEIDSNVKREEIEALVKELMGGEKGKEMKIKAMKWKKSAAIATTVGGSSYTNLEVIISELLKPRDK